MDKNNDILEIILKEEPELSLDSETSQSPSIITSDAVENKLPDISRKCGEILLKELETFVIVCSYCRTMYSNYEDFIFHLKTQHDELLKFSQFYDKNDYPDFKTNQINNETDEHIDYKHNIDFVDAEKVESIILTSNQESNLESSNNDQQRIREKKKRIWSFPCDICCIKFRTKKALNEHQTENHSQDCLKDQSEDETNEISKLKTEELSKRKRKRKFPCEVCSMVFKTKKSLNEHEEIEHQDVKNLNSEHDTYKKMELTEDKSNTSPSPKSFQCTICDKTYHRKENLQRHSLSHKSFEEHPYKCEHCNKTFSSPFYLKGHIRWHNNDSLPCRICGREFYTNRNRKRHEIIHGEKQLLCTICGKKFYGHSSLRDHMMRHEGIKPHKCEYCTMSFASSTGLVEHRRKHTGEKPYKCDICGGRFSISSSLKKHKKLHSDVAEYKCKICGKSFKQNAGLYMHSKTHRIDN